MADKTTKLTAPSGATVSVESSKVDGLLRRGFTEAKATTSKAPAKKAASSKSSE